MKMKGRESRIFFYLSLFRIILKLTFAGSMSLIVRVNVVLNRTVVVDSD